nr:putative ribonuclease H-like domain-containing protein [Tanacetum cinerariifolium]
MFNCDDYLSSESDESLPPSPIYDRQVVPATVLTKSKLVPIITVRPVSIVVPKTKVTRRRQDKHVVTKPNSPPRRHINRSPSPKANILPPKVTAIKASMGNPRHALKDKGVIDSGCSWHTTGNMSYLSDFEELNGRYFAFGGNPKGGKIFGKGKFDGKVDEGFLVGYSVSSKAFRVFDSRTRILQETLHVNFLENKSNVTGSGPTWLFDIDTLTKTMNYQPVTTGNQSNPSAGVQEQFDIKKAGEEGVPQYVLFPVWSSGFANPQNTDGDAAFNEKEPEFDEKKPESEVNVSSSSSAQSKKHDDKTKREAKGKSLVESLTGYRNLSAEFKDFSDNIINKDNAAGTLVPAVGQIFPNSTNTFSAAGPSNVVAIPTQGKSSYNVGAEADFNNLETSITVSHILTIRVHKDHPVTKIIGDLSLTTQTRCMTRVAKDQGHTQKEGINYEEVFSLVARIEAIRLFLTYASFMGFMVYQMDVKSAFLYEIIKEEVYVCQPLGPKNPDYPDKVYKVVKAFYRPHQAPIAWYETLANYLLENGFQRGKIDQTLFIKRQKGDILLAQIYVDDIIFGLTNKDLCKAFEKLMKDKFQMSSMRELTFFSDGKLASTPIDTEKPLLKDPDGEDDSPFDLVAYSDSDYAGASLDRKSTTGGCQFLGCRLISWQCKKQTVVATSSTKAEYVYGVFEKDVSCYKYLKCWFTNHTTNGSQFTMSNPHKELASPDQAVSGKDSSNPLMANNFPKIVWYSTHHVVRMKSWLVQKQTTHGQTTTGKEISNPFMAGSLPKTILLTFIHDAGLPMDLLQNIMDTCTTLTRRVENLEQDKIAQALEITKLKSRVKKLERRNKASKLKRMIADMDTDVDVSLEDAKEVVEKSADVDESADAQGRKADSQAQIYQIDLEHANKVLSMQDDEGEPAELQEVVEVVKTAKLIPEGVKIRDPQETATPSTIIHSEAKSKDKGKGILVEEPKPLKKKAKIEQDEAYTRELEAEKPETEAQARKNMMIYLRNVVGFKMDYFKGMSYDDIRPIFEKHFNSNVAFLQKTKEQMDEEDSRALKRLNESQEDKAAKKQKLDEEVEELKRHLQIVPNDEDDVYTEATPLALKLILLVERRYPLIRFTLDQMLNNVRLDVEKDSEVSLELLRFIRHQHQEGFQLE